MFNSNKAIIAVRVLILLVVLAVTCYTDYLQMISERQKQEQRTLIILGDIKSDIELLLGSKLQMASGLVNYVSMHPDLDQRQFEQYAQKLLEQNPHIKNIALGQDYKVTHLHPIVGNEKALSIDYKQLPDQYSAIQQAISHKQVVLAGPVELVQGGKALIARLPIYTDSEIWGFASVVIDFESILNEINLDRYNNSIIAIKGKDSLGHKGGFIAGNKELLQYTDTIATSVNFPFGSWYVVAKPKDNWMAYHFHLNHWIVAGVVILLLFSGVSLRLNNQRLAKEKEKALLRSEQTFRSFFHLHRVSMLIIDDKWKVCDSNLAAQQFYGYSATDFKGKVISGIKEAWQEIEDVESIKEQIDAIGGDINEDNVYMLMSKVIKTRHVLLSGVHKDVEIHVTPVDDKGASQYFLLIFDVTTQKEHEQQWRLFEQVYKHSQEGIFVTDSEHNIVSTNPAFERITGYTKSEVFGKNPSILSSGRHDSYFYKNMYKSINENGFWRGEVWNKSKNGKIYPQLLSISEVRDNEQNLSHFVAVFADISKQKDSEEKLQKLAHYDQLTGLPNRLTLRMHLEREIKRAKRTGGKCALLFLDLDRFKVVNDSLGHRSGDELLCKVGERLKNRVRETDVLARLGGDEFVILVNNYSDENHLSALANSLAKQITQPFTLTDGVEANVGLSIGIAQFPKDANSADDLLKYSDASMYKAKKSKDTAFVFYTRSISDEASSRLTINAEVKQAVRNNEFELLLQPQVELSSNKIVSAEALIRWRHPHRGYLTPNEFIPLAESTGVIKLITKWVVQRSFQIAEHWFYSKYNLRLAVNVSAAELSDHDLFDVIHKLAIDKPHLTQYLTFEIVESALVENRQFAKELLQNLRELGFLIAIDDFGTGFSSLSYLSDLPIDTLKIDRVFVQNMETEKQNGIVKSIINLANNFDLKVVGEGIETLEHEAALLRLGCDYGQGYLYSKAISQDQIEVLYNNQQSMSFIK